MSTIKDSDPAFPSTNGIRLGDVISSGHSGMPLRDYFAAKALPVVFEMVMQEARDGSGLSQYFNWRTALAFHADLRADAMLAAREKGGA